MDALQFWGGEGEGRQGEARQGKARKGKKRKGKARKGKEGCFLLFSLRMYMETLSTEGRGL